jgi:hypothetical protein
MPLLLFILRMLKFSFAYEPSIDVFIAYRRSKKPH